MPAPRRSSRGRHEAPRRTDEPGAALPATSAATETPAAPGEVAAVSGPTAGAPVGPAHRAVRTEAHSHRAAVPADRRERPRAARSGTRRSTRVARGAVAVGLALGVGALAIAPSLISAAETTDAAQAGDPAEQVPATPTGPTTVEVQERQAAVVLAAATAQQAGDAQAAAVASAVSGDALTPLESAISDLATLMATTQAVQPAISELRPTTVTATLPVVTEDMLASADEAAAAAAAAADAAQAGVDVAAGTGAEDLATTGTTDAAGTAESDAAATAATDAPTASDAGPTGTATASATATAGTAEAEDVSPADPVAARLSAAVERVAALTAEVQVVTQQSQEAATAAAAAAEEARKEAQRTSLDSYDNGRIPDSALCALDFADGQELRCDAAEALDALNIAFRAEFGTDLAITDSYRSYAAQVACRRQKGSLCATPGTSNHGNGTAVDLGGDAYTFGTDQHDWMLAHAAEFGWELPDWAQAGGSKPEPWHWEFVG